MRRREMDLKRARFSIHNLFHLLFGLQLVGLLMNVVQHNSNMPLDNDVFRIAAKMSNNERRNV